ncbi:MAG: hypothetical protein K6T78_10805 [Alicyclobacillus sp.]|nr:hypothetical protein [Alicyclobacillus sp.]
MASAICPYCKEPAYSSAGFDEPWTCPSCGKMVIPTGEDARRRRAVRDAYVETYSRYWTKVDVPPTE